jgi:hypothetical protein
LYCSGAKKATAAKILCGVRGTVSFPGLEDNILTHGATTLHAACILDCWSSLERAADWRFFVF